MQRCKFNAAAMQHNSMHMPTLPPRPTRTDLSQFEKRFPRKAKYRIELIPWAKLYKFMLREEPTWSGAVQRKQIRAGFFFPSFQL